MKLGIISDTHGLLRESVLLKLSECDYILHAGDIDRPAVLEKLESLAPVYVVEGNNDWEFSGRLPIRIDVTLEGLRICMAHRRMDLPADLSPFGLAVCGHSHRFELSRLGNTVILNPGSCGRSRFGRALTMATAEVTGGVPTVTRIDIDEL
ncbi:MAG: metallophosphoesterase family protein [Oscillospiraceae bacterium]|nr:metallophosphoesterase family protein [Oscillospiraceae bacterium]